MTTKIVCIVAVAVVVVGLMFLADRLIPKSGDDVSADGEKAED